MHRSLHRWSLFGRVRLWVQPALYLGGVLLYISLLTLLFVAFLGLAQLQAQANRPSVRIYSIDHSDSKAMLLWQASPPDLAQLITATLTETATEAPLPVVDPPTETATSIPSDTATFTATNTPLPTETAPLTVTPTATDLPLPTVTPTATDVPLPVDTATSTATATLLPTTELTATATPVPIDTITPSPTDTPTTPATNTPTMDVTVAPTPPPRLLITEFMADPKAVSDVNGEWFELYNPTANPVNLRGWMIKDLGSDQHMIDTDLILQSGAYLVLGRNSDPTTNGGAPIAYVYTGINLANSTDALLLLAPDGSEMDRVVWGAATGLTVQSGASLQRTAVEGAPIWVIAQQPWLGSVGDAGTPNGAYVPPPTGTPTVTPLPGNSWIPVTTPSPLQIEEVAYQGSTEEYIALLNVSDNPIDLAGWSIGDAETPGNNEGMYALPDDVVLNPGTLFVIARNGATFYTAWGRLADAAFEEQDANTPVLAHRRDLASGSLALNDSGDEVVLLNAAGQLADAVAFTNGNYAALSLTGEARPPKGYSLQRVPGAAFPLVADVRQRFLYAPPSPFDVRPLPTAQTHNNPTLADNFVAVWGSLGAHSNFSAGYTAPPHYLLAAAGALGLDFTAIADSVPATPISNQGAVIDVPAWSWQGDTGAQAVIYSNQSQAMDSEATLLDYLTTTAGVAQWQGTGDLPLTGIAAIAADDSGAPGDLTALYKRWQSTDAALLPAGNANPPLPGAVDPAPRYTGLAVSSVDAAGIRQAVADHRGWLTNTPGLWLTLQAELSNGERRWMGSLIPSSNQITLHIAYGDRNGQVAGLALWQDNQPVRQLDTPPSDGQWSLTLPAIPGSILYVVATQADGDFAVTAPLRVRASRNGTVLINEVLPGPAADLNGDGQINGNDEFIELYNPGDEPLALGRWQLTNTTGDQTVSRRFTFGVGRYIKGGERLLLWRTESHINLNKSQDYVRLLNPAGAEVDRINWARSPVRGSSISRIPDGQAWQMDTKVTAGKPNAPSGSSDDDASPLPSEPHSKQEPTPGPTLEPTYGQAGGPPASVAQSKLAGLEAWVEFRAVVIAPPGLFNTSIYIADPAPDATGPYVGIGINVFLRKGDFPPLQEGDLVLVRGRLRSFRGEMELQLESPDQIGRIGAVTPLQPLPVMVADIAEALEGRLVTFTGVVSRWQGDSIYLSDPTRPDAEPVRVTVRSSLAWKRPYVNKGDRFQVTGVVSQMASATPWNNGYRVLVRYKTDLVKIKK